MEGGDILVDEFNFYPKKIQALLESGQGAAAVMGFMVVPIYLRYLGPQAYGLVAFFMSLLAGKPAMRVIFPATDDIWFIMWCGRWQCSIQSPGLLATNSISRACETPTSTVLPGHHAVS